MSRIRHRTIVRPVAPRRDIFGEPCDRCGKSIPSNRDRSPNYCTDCAVPVTAQGGDED